MSTTLDRPDDHDPFCPRSDLTAAWNGADCHCVTINLLREVEGIELQRGNFEQMLHDIEETIRMEGGFNVGHDPLCPPGLKATTPDRCHYCITLTQARQEGPLS